MNKKAFYLGSAVCLMACMISSCGDKSETGQTAEAVKVKTLTVRETVVEDGHRYSGTIEEETGTSVSFATAGTVQQVLVGNGQRVNKGQLIATLDATTLQQTHNAALSMLRQAEDAYQRMARLHDTHSISEMQWVEVQSRVEQARSSEEIARRALSDTRLVAPASGVVCAKNLEPGQNVLPGMTVMKIVEIDKVKVSIAVPEKEVGTIANGTDVNVRVPALATEEEPATFQGVVSEKNVTANALTRTYNIKATVSNPDHRLMPGMICEAWVCGNGKAATTFTLPVDAVQLSDKNFYFVWTVREGKATRRFVTVGSVTAIGVTITDGLRAGDTVIVEGMQKVCEGMEVSNAALREANS